jgi:abelson tyrosine-protein kinase 1
MSALAVRLLDVVEGSDRWEVNRNALTMVEKLGEGQFGDVVKMATTLFSEDGSMDFVAVKTLKIGGLAASGAAVSDKAELTAQTDFLAEINLMKRLRHPNLVTLLAVCTRAPPFLAVLEFLKGGSLDIWLPKNGSMLLMSAPAKLVYMLHQIALGCQALVRCGIVHRDLAARNVLVGDRLHLKVADFGLSREVDDDKDYYRLASERLLPLRWMAPETVTTLTWTSEADCYAFGIVVFEVFTFGGRPFHDIDSDVALIETLIGSSQIHPLLISQVAVALAQHASLVPPLVTELVRRCTARDPSCRPTFDELVHLTSRSPVDGAASSAVHGGNSSGVCGRENDGGRTSTSENGQVTGGGASLEAMLESESRL